MHWYFLFTHINYVEDRIFIDGPVTEVELSNPPKGLLPHILWIATETNDCSGNESEPIVKVSQIRLVHKKSCKTTTCVDHHGYAIDQKISEPGSGSAAMLVRH